MKIYAIDDCNFTDEDIGVLVGYVVKFKGDYNGKNEYIHFHILKIRDAYLIVAKHSSGTYFNGNRHSLGKHCKKTDLLPLINEKSMTIVVMDIDLQTIQRCFKKIKTWDGIWAK